MPKREPTASSTRMPSGTTSVPIPSPGITAMLCRFTALALIVDHLPQSRDSSGSRHGPPGDPPIAPGLSPANRDPRNPGVAAGRVFGEVWPTTHLLEMTSDGSERIRQ